MTASNNLDLVRSIFAAWERGDYSSAEWAHPEIEFASPVGVETGSWTGVAEMARVWRETMGAYEEFRVKADEYRELDDERVLVLTRSSGRGKTSGLELDSRCRTDAGVPRHSWQARAWDDHHQPEPSDEPLPHS